MKVIFDGSDLKENDISDTWVPAQMWSKAPMPATLTHQRMARSPIRVFPILKMNPFRIRFKSLDVNCTSFNRFLKVATI